MKNRWHLTSKVIFTLIIFYFRPAQAQNVTLTDLIKIVNEQNPALQSAKSRWQGMKEKYPQENAYDDPMIMYGYFSGGQQKHELSLTQNLPYPGKLKHKGKIVIKEAEMAGLAYEKENIDIIGELKDTFYEWNYTEQAIKIVRQNKELTEHLAKIGVTDYSFKMDGTTSNDIFKAQSQLAQLSYDLLLLEELRQTQIGRINSLLNRPQESLLGEPAQFDYVPFKYSLEELYKLAKDNQPELRMTDKEIEKNQALKELSKLDKLPDFILGVGYMNMRSDGMESPHAFKGSIGINIPFWWQKYNARVKESEFALKAAAYDKKNRENILFSEIKTGYFRMHNAERLIKLYRESILPQALRSIEIAENWYKEKKGSFSGLLETQSVWLNFNLALQKAISDYYQQIAGLERLVGVSPLILEASSPLPSPQSEELELEKRKEAWADMIKKPEPVKSFYDFETPKSKEIRELAKTEKIKGLLSQELDPETIISVAFERNPGIKAARKNWEASIEKYPQVTQLDNILRQYQSFTKTEEIFPFPGMLALKGDIVGNEVKMAREDYFIEQRELVTRISEAYEEIIFNKAEMEITRENLQLFKDLESIVSLRYSTGATPFNDLINLQMEIARLNNELKTLQENKNTLIARINQELNLSPGFSLGEITEYKIKLKPFSLSELYELGLNNQQELKRMKLELEGERLMLILGEKEFYPDLRPMPEENPPVWFGANDAYLRESRLRYQAMQEKLTFMQDKLFFEIKEMTFELDKSAREKILYADSLLGQARMAIQVGRKEYETGKIDFPSLLDLQKKLLEFNLNYKRAIKEYNQGIIRLEKTIGIRIREERL